MKKILISTALASLLLSCSVSANWVTGEATVLAVNRGEAAFHTILSSQQRLDAGITAGECGMGDVIFSTASSDTKLTLNFPVRQVSGTSSDGSSYTDARLTVTPLINTDNGRRFYLVEAGSPEGTRVIAYKKGNFISAFDASSLKGDFDELSFRVGKKELILHTVNAGRSADYVLKFDSKTDSFNATLKA